jgi:hypothetical protein
MMTVLAWASLHRSKGILILGIVRALCACQGSGASQTVTVYVPTTLQGLPLAGDSAFYQGFGDFEPSVQETETASLAATGLALSSLPAATRSMLVTLIGSTLEGVALVPASGPVNVLALPLNTATQFSDLAGSLGGTAGPSMGTIDSGHALAVGGQSQIAYFIDLGTGELTPVTGDSPTYSRDFATITPFAGGALVAGGTGTVRQDADTAQVYQAAANGGPGGFGTLPQITLLQGRIKHAAVAMANGDTLLIGGESPAGNLLGLGSLELVEPGQPDSTLVRAELEVPRISPSALLLSGIEGPRLLVGGGFDGTGKPVSKVEWFDVPGSASSNAAASITWAYALDLCTTSGLELSGEQVSLAACCPGDSLLGPPAFASLAGGSVLVVLAGMPPTQCPSNVLLLRNDFTLEIAPPGPTAIQPRLFFGAQSEPVYFPDDGVAERWDPWFNGFSMPLGNAAEGTTLLLASLSPDPGLALWLGQDSHIWGLRFDTRNAYSTDEPETVLLRSDSREFAPDRLVNLPDSDGFIDVSPFEPGIGVTLQNGGRVFLEDATFADFTLEFSSTGPLALVLSDQATGGELTFDQGNCLPPVTGGPFRMVRTGGTLTAAGTGSNGAATPAAPCAGGPVAGDRVAIGFQAPPGEKATVSTVSVQRLGSPN